MSDPVKTQTDTVVTDAQKGTEASSPVKTDTEGSLILGKYKTMEEAEKGYKEVEKMATQKAQEAADARRQLAEVSEKAQLNQGIASLIEQLKPKEQPPDYKGFVTNLAETARNDPGKAMEDFSLYVNSVANDVERKAIGAAEKKFSELQAEIQSLRDNVEKDTFYQENQETIESLRKDGMSLAKAKD